MSTEENKAIEARKATTVFRATDVELNQTMVYLFQLVGLNTDRYPGDAAKLILVDFIRTNYAGNTLDEIKQAFQMGISGKLDIEDAGHYQSFSSLYFGKIMAAYRIWSSQVHEYVSKTVIPEEPKQEVPDISDQDLLTATFESYKVIRKIDFIPESLFGFLEESRKIELPVEEKLRVKDHVSKLYNLTDKDIIKSYSRKFAVAQYFEYVMLKNEKP